MFDESMNSILLKLFYEIMNLMIYIQCLDNWLNRWPASYQFVPMIVLSILNKNRPKFLQIHDANERAITSQ